MRGPTPPIPADPGPLFGPVPFLPSPRAELLCADPCSPRSTPWTNPEPRAHWPVTPQRPLLLEASPPEPDHAEPLLAILFLRIAPVTPAILADLSIHGTHAQNPGSLL